jgi:hypothetical protein
MDLTLGPADTLTYTKHVIQRMMERASCNRDTAVNYLHDLYVERPIVYASKTHLGQLKIQGPQFVMSYDPAAHKIITVFINGFLQNDAEFERKKQKNRKRPMP